uniref:Uncharacterized protein n=1 Tax=viral metagenome TaxID=1070528 RepID=A0A2V0RCA7_9ZZZZ
MAYPDGSYDSHKVYEMTLSSSRQGSNNYRVVNGVHYDTELIDINPLMSEILKDNNISYVSVVEPRKVHDRSWEMSVALTAIRGRSTFATGVLTSYENKHPQFGPIVGLDKKIKVFNGLPLEHV